MGNAIPVAPFHRVKLKVTQCPHPIFAGNLTHPAWWIPTSGSCLGHDNVRRCLGALPPLSSKRHSQPEFVMFLNASGPASLAGNQCPPSPRQSPSTSATWPQTARPAPPSRRPEPRSPTPMPPRAYQRAITPPAIQPWPRSSRAGAIRLQRPNRPTTHHRRTHHRCPGPHPGDCVPSETRPRGRMESAAVAQAGRHRPGNRRSDGRWRTATLRSRRP